MATPRPSAIPAEGGSLAGRRRRRGDVLQGVDQVLDDTPFLVGAARERLSDDGVAGEDVASLAEQPEQQLLSAVLAECVIHQHRRIEQVPGPDHHLSP